MLSLLPLFYFIALPSPSTFPFVTSSWTGGPSDTFFCGYKWDDDDCQKRQHCPSGESEECEGNEEFGVKCFANTNCDTRYGHGEWFVAGKPPKISPGGTPRPTFEGTSDVLSDHYWCGAGVEDAQRRCGTYEQHCPSGTSGQCPQGEVCYHNIMECNAKNLSPPTAQPITDQPTKSPAEAGPTYIPTDMPIPPPDPLPYPSEDPSDHWFCGIGIDDASRICGVHCPSASECPSGQICYFGTKCDARTFSPTPPPTRRPTPLPTLSPTGSPTFTTPPSYSPSESMPPSAAPTLPQPTKSPSPAPTKRPTYAPMPSLQASFFCGKDWNDAIENCKRRCPTGESTECPFDEHCFSLTPCTEEMGYPEEYGLEGYGVNEIGGGVGGDAACVPLEVTIVADHWPKETSWVVTTTDFGDIVAEGKSDELDPGEPVKYIECINNRKGCYEFTINDTGGDGICCEHGNGSYKVSWDGVELKQGAAFYEAEITPFGLCGETAPPTVAPTTKTVSVGGGGGKPGDAAYRCVANPLVESGYEVSGDKCDLFTDCYNKYIDVGDDFFCDDNSQCVDTPECSIKESSLADEPQFTPDTAGQFRCIENQLVEAGYEVSSDKCSMFVTCLYEGDTFYCSGTETCTKAPNCGDVNIPAIAVETPEPKSPPTSEPTQKIVVSRPESKPKPVVLTPIAESKTPTPRIKETKTPTPVPTGTKETDDPTMIPTTYQPTYGECDGDKCNQDDHCRSKFGFCGPGETYCNDNAIWSGDCPAPEPTSKPSPSPVTDAPTTPPVTNSPVTLAPTVISVLNNLGEETEPPTAGAVTTLAPSKKKFTKPTGFKKPGGGKGSVSKPVRTHAPMTYFPTRRPTNRPTEKSIIMNDPIDNPSSSPISTVGTAFVDNPKATLPTKYPSSQPTDYPTDRPTTRPTDRPTVVTLQPATPSPTDPGPSFEVDTDAVVSSKETQPNVETSVVPKPETNSNAQSTTSDTFWTPANEYDCTGEPCPVSTHCRSRYGSCGPGFIYCNMYSVWKDECPPIDPSRTRSPTPKPTKKPTPSASPIIFTLPVEPSPTFPPFAKPSLPGIIEAIPFTLPSSFSATDGSSAKSDEAKDHDEELLVSEIEPEPTLKPSDPDIFQSPEYLNEWTFGRGASNSARERAHFLIGGSAIYLLVAPVLNWW